MRRLDTGSEPFFGDFTVVFNSCFSTKGVLAAAGGGEWGSYEAKDSRML